MTESKYAAAYEATLTDSEHRISVSGVLKHLGVSKSGYYDRLKREPSNQSIHRKVVMESIKEIYDNSFCIYGAPKITRELHKRGLNTAERTVTRYMKEVGIRACWVKPYTVTIHSEDFSDRLQNILSRNFSPKGANAVWCTDITYMLVFEYIDMFYNTRRIHSICDYMSPSNYENLFYLAASCVTSHCCLNQNRNY